MIHFSSESDTMKAVELQWHKEQYFGIVCIIVVTCISCKTANVKWVIVQGAIICKYSIVNYKEYHMEENFGG